VINTRRRLKVEHCGDFAKRKTYPLVRIRGNWLRDAGFLPNSYVSVIIEQGKIILVPILDNEKTFK
jgi:hypothetical protein